MTYALSPFEAELRAFDQTPAQRGAVVFYGSSSFRLWDHVGEAFAGLPVVNRGFGGSTLAECLYLLPRVVVPLAPSRLVLYAGDNDLDQGTSPERLLDLLARFVDEFRRVFPAVPLLYVAIKPSPSRAGNLANIRRANELARGALERRGDVEFLDVFTPMLGPGGGPRPELFTGDGLHMNGAGYALWTTLIGEWLTREPRVS